MPYLLLKKTSEKKRSASSDEGSNPDNKVNGNLPVVCSETEI